MIELDLDADAIAPEDVVELFVALARDLKAFFAAAQVEPGWKLRDGRLYGIAEDWDQRRQPILRGRTWRDLPPVPMWLSWYGGPYRDLVLPHLDGRLERATETVAPDGLRGVFRGLDLTANVQASAHGVLLRLGEQPRSPAQLGDAWPLPAQLTYRHAPRWIRTRGRTSSQITAIQEEAAPFIPSI